jgi:signal transduction histidine kinase
MGPAPVDRAIAGGLGLFLVFSLIQGRSAARTLHDSLAIRAENSRLLAAATARHAEAQAARRVAEEAAASKARFFAAASHDLRQPMQALVLLDAALQQATPAERPALQARLGEGVRTLDRLFEAILSVSSLQARPVGAGTAPLPLADLAATLQARYGPQAEARGLRLVWRSSSAAQAVQGEAAALERLLGNLVANALRFTPAGGCVLLAWRGGHGGGPLRLQVRDNGCGIAAEDQARVFDAFVQVGNPHRDRDAGTGLGLAIARRLAEDLGGTLGLRSAPGRGSCFELRLPGNAPGWVLPVAPSADALQDAMGAVAPLVKSVAPHRAQAVDGAGGAPAGPAAGAARSVWVVDDDPLVRDALAALLGGWGLAVQAAAHPDGLPADGPPPDLLVCDRMLPGIDGLDAAQAMQARWRPAPRVVLLSGLRDDTARATARARGWVWLDKPVRPMALRACLAAPAPAGIGSDGDAR